MTADCFAIYIVPKAPVILGRRMNLDALLAAMLMRRLLSEGVAEDVALRRAHEEIPLEMVNSVYAGSSAMVSRTTTTDRIIYGSFHRFVTALPSFDVFAKNKRKSVVSRDYDLVEKTYQTFVSNHVQYHLQSPGDDEDARGFGIWFVGYGDRDRVKNLMDDLRYIGAKRTAIQRPEFVDAKPTSSPGLLGHDGTVLRPIPCDAGFEPEPGKFDRAFERSLPPYWGRSVLAKDPVLCYVPPQAMRASSHQIKRAIGVI